MRLPYYVVDAFTKSVFGGNPAAVCPLESWLDDATLQKIGAENNLAETAFFVPDGDDYHLRWFTPAVEMDLCGHATLASAFVLWTQLGVEKPTLRFGSRSGELVVTREGELMALDFPSRPPVRVDATEELTAAIGREPLGVWKSRDYVALFEDEAAVRALQPNFDRVAGLDAHALVVTAKGSDCDFVSRFFAPALGVNEDPVTGSAHCELIPFWAERLGKTTLFARQLSKRGGELFCELKGDRVKMAGHAALYAEGVCYV